MDRRRLVIFSAVVIGAMLLLSTWAWLSLPADAQVPIHWGLDGQANGFADKTIGLFLVPLITIGLAALMWVIPVIEPRRANFEKSGKAYGAIWVGLILLMAVIEVVTVAAAKGLAFDVSALVFAGTGVLFIVIGNYLPKIRSNYLMGIRTPWTLTSDVSWTKTHRLGGWLFVIEGIAFIVLAIVRPAPGVLFALLMGGMILMIVVLFAYSYQVWKTDPARRES